MLGLDRLFTFVSHCHSALDQTGLHVEQAAHINDVRNAAERLGRQGVSHALDPDFTDLTSATAIWLLVYHRATTTDRERTLVGMVGARVEDIARGEFEPVLSQRMKRLHNASSISTPTPPVFGEIVGRVAYIGDLYILPDHRGAAGGNLRALLLLLFAYARVEWRFDWLYGFVSREHAEQSYLATYCFTMTYPSDALWALDNSNDGTTDIFGCLSRDDFAYLTDIITRRPNLLTLG